MQGPLISIDGRRHPFLFPQVVCPCVRARLVVVRRRRGPSRSGYAWRREGEPMYSTVPLVQKRQFLVGKE